MLIGQTEAERFAKLGSGVTLCREPQRKLEVKAPFTGEVLGYIPAGTEADADAAVTRARTAQADWARRSFEDRANIFLRFHDLLMKRQREVLDIIQLETGKARRHAFEEVLDTAGVARYYSLRSEELLQPRRHRGALPFLTMAWEFRVPLGVVGFISPWNYPLNLAVTDAIPALMAGNAGVLKPDAQTSFTALWALGLLREAGLPVDVFQIVTGEGSVMGPALGDRVDFLMFTGSSRTGRIVGRQAAGRLIGCSLELGGKNAMIVLADADLEGAVDGAIRACFVGAGQVCISIERIYVHSSLFDRFLSRFAERAKGLKLGAAFDYSIEMGSLTSERQLDTVEQHVRDAVEKGATLVAGGHRRTDLGPLFYEPTILINVLPNMQAFAEETFGPVVSVYPYTTEDEVVGQVNASRYGLSACIWTRDPTRAIRFARRIQFGSVNINEPYAAAWGSVDSPIGGMKESGIGARHGAEGILKFTDSQTVALQRLLSIGPARGRSASFHARYMTWALRLLRRIRFLG
jgi:succinate-semialdehyde dehydrogenase/glutarate-semialdehyde dehydrogenase